MSPPEQVLNQAQQKHREEVKELMDEVLVDERIPVTMLVQK